MLAPRIAGDSCKLRHTADGTRVVSVWRYEGNYQFTAEHIWLKFRGKPEESANLCFWCHLLQQHKQHHVLLVHATVDPYLDLTQAAGLRQQLALESTCLSGQSLKLLNVKFGSNIL